MHFTGGYRDFIKWWGRTKRETPHCSQGLTPESRICLLGQLSQYRRAPGHCTFGGVEVQIGKDTELPLVFSVPSSIRKEGAGFLLWDVGAHRGWEALGWGRTAWAGGQVTIHSALGWAGWMASPTQWTWVWANSGRWWRKGKLGVLQSMGSQAVRLSQTWLSNWTTI